MERATELTDPALRVEPGTNKILRCFQIALLCVQDNRADRPTMSDVLMMLKCDCLTLPVPMRPEDQWGPRGLSADDSDSVGHTCYSSAGWTSEELEGR